MPTSQQEATHTPESKPGVSVLDHLTTLLYRPVEVSSLVVFRVGFGLIMAAWAADYLRSGRLTLLYEAHRFHFTYYLFDFIRPWRGLGMTWHFVGLMLLAFCIAAGLFYRLAATLFAVGFTYFFLVDRTNYQNHYYLLMLISWTMVLLPLNRHAAIDCTLGLTRPSNTAPAWYLWLLRFHVALPYSFGGIAKLHSDWFAGEPMRTHLATKTWWPIFQPLLMSEVTVAICTWGGLFFDLAVVPLLLWRPTRLLAYSLCVCFHLANALLFDIHVFPWFMIFATTIFFEPNWPIQLWRQREQAASECHPWSRSTLSWQRRSGCLLISLYCISHVLVPLRPLVYAGNSAWTERGHHFSWRMMLRTKASALRYYVTDPKTGQTGTVDLRRFLNLNQVTTFSRDPEMILHLAHFLQSEFRRETGRDVEVRALVLTTLNGRKPELLIDPSVDLTKEPRGFYFRSWILPQHEPLRAVAWSVPMLDWERNVNIPHLRFLSRRGAGLDRRRTGS